MNKIRKISAGLDYPIVLLEEFLAVEDDNVCTTLIIAEKGILKYVQSSKSIIDADSDDENEMKTTPISTSSEMRNIVKSMRSY
ncbi:hypothetical protein TNCV_3322091 [Trichonephila clavipes]|nr:hypothetical protein TNCV_3322091 [Trichonephila clavipes]